MKRDFADWLSHFRGSIADYGYYVDFEKVYRNIDSIRIELNILNSLVGSKNIERDFERIITEYPNTLRCIPLLLAVRSGEIYAVDGDGEFVYSFRNLNHSIEQYKTFMRKSGLFGLMESHAISSIVDYATGVETGLDSNGRKNRGGDIMENLVEDYIRKAGFIKNISYFKELKLSEIEAKWHINLASISNRGKAEKRFDFVIKTPGMIYAVEANFYSGGGSKLNETARSYKTLALEASAIEGFSFVWFTDGRGWLSARNNLEETFDIMDHIYCIYDMERGIMKELFV